MNHTLITKHQTKIPQHNIKEVLLFPAMKPDQARQLQNAQIAAAARAAVAAKGVANLSISADGNEGK